MKVEAGDGLKEKKKSTKDNFRLHAMYLFLTYSRCPNKWSKEFVRKKLIEEILVNQRGDKKYKSKVRSWVIAEENHEEKIGSGDYERGHHFHCLLECEKKVDIKNVSELDLKDEEGNIVHGNYQAVKDIFAVLNYVKKHGNWIGEGFPGMASKERAILSASKEDAELMVMPQMSAKEKLALREAMVERIERKTTIEEIITKAPLFAFQEMLMPFHKGAGFFEKGRPMGLVMSGEAESGKTTMAYRVAKDLNQELAIYRDPKEMLHHDKEQVILFDEMTNEKFKENRKLLSILVTEPQAKTESYYGSKKAKWPRKILIATNEDVGKWDWDEATRSRFIVVRTFADGKYVFCKFEGNVLKTIKTEDLKELLKKESSL
jgi:hypothetical protein